ncbi:MAG: ATP-grasp domain-containing protein [Gammaproteobacteria bacterium]|nr:ATP-grasp domain-containing protein [Gammaproteobacteria bacterium]
MDKVLVQDTWSSRTGEDDLLLYLEMFARLDICTKETILKRIRLSDYDCVFLDRDVLVDHMHIPSYPECFNSMYRREIVQSSSRQFIKGRGEPKYICMLNTSLMKSQIIDPCDELQCLDLLYASNGESVPLYVCEIIEFFNQYRMFIIGGKIHSMVETSKMHIDHDLIISVDPPRDFISQVLRQSIYPVCVIDVGMQSNGTFCVVQVHPALSLDRCDLNVSSYFDFCRAAWKYYLKRGSV